MHWDYEAPDAKLSGRNWVLGGRDQPNLFSITDKHIITAWRGDNAVVQLMVSDADGIGSITGFERSGWYTIDKVENVKELNHIDAGGVAVLSDGSVLVAYAIDFAGIDDLKHFKKQLRLAVFEPGVIRLPKRQPGIGQWVCRLIRMAADQWYFAVSPASLPGVMCHVI